MQGAARRIVRKLRAQGHEALFAGGCVRDALLRRKPKDIDIATSARPEEVMRLFPKATAIGVHFGVVQVRSYGRSYEVATFRTEGPYFDGRHPSSVAFASAREDAVRRDFTINGLFLDPLSGRILDFVHGRQDLRNGLVRTIGNPADRFREDRLRMLRALRFACSLGFHIEPATWDAIRAHASLVTEVSAERIRDEILRMVAGPFPGRCLELLADSGLLGVLLPEVEAMRGVPQPPEFHPEGDVFVHTALTLGQLRRPSPVLALAALLHDIGKPPTIERRERIRFDQHSEVGAEMAAGICRRLRLSSEETARVAELVRHHLRFMHVQEMRRSTLCRFLTLPHFDDHLELHRADCLASHRKLDSYRFCRKRIRELNLEGAAPAPLLSGRDLIALGYAPGPLFGRILAAVGEMQLEGVLSTADEARAFVRSNYPIAGEDAPAHESP